MKTLNSFLKIIKVLHERLQKMGWNFNRFDPWKIFYSISFVLVLGSLSIWFSIWISFNIRLPLTSYNRYNLFAFLWLEICSSGYIEKAIIFWLQIYSSPLATSRSPVLVLSTEMALGWLIAINRYAPSLLNMVNYVLELRSLFMFSPLKLICVW